MTDRLNKFRLVSTASAIAFAVVFCNAASAQRIPENLQAVADLKSNDWHKRVNAAGVIRDTSPPNRSRAMIQGVVDELRRLQLAPSHGMNEVPPGVDRLDGWNYYCTLLDVAVATDDDLVIPVLVNGVETGANVIQSLARRGNAAAVPLIDAIRRHQDGSYLISALRTLDVMIQRKTSLPAPTRSAIVDVTRTHLEGHQYSVVVVLALELAGDLNDPGLKLQILRISRAKSAQEAGLTLVDPEGFPMIMKASAATATKLGLPRLP